MVLWDVAARKRLVDEPLAVKEGNVGSVAFSPDGKTIAAGYGDSDGEWRRGAVGRGRTQTTWRRAAPREGGQRWSVAFSPDGKTIAAGYGGALAATAAGWCCGTWPHANACVDEPLAVNEGNVTSVAFSPDGKTIAAGYERRLAAAAAWCCGTWPTRNAWSTSHSP